MSKAILLVVAVSLALGMGAGVRAADSASPAQTPTTVPSQGDKKPGVESATADKSKKEAEESCCCDGTCGVNKSAVNWSPRGKELWGK